ncbi:hypothetical protein YC2023_077677 [Brassica napus]
METLVSIWSLHGENGGLEDGSLLVMVVTCSCAKIFVRGMLCWDQRHALLGSRASDPWALKSLSSALVSFDGLRWYVWCSCEGRLRLSCGGSVAARGMEARRCGAPRRPLCLLLVLQWLCSRDGVARLRLVSSLEAVGNRVFQGLRASFSLVARGNWLLTPPALRPLVFLCHALV